MILTGLTFLLINAQETSKNVNDSKTAKNAKIAALLFFFLKENVLIHTGVRIKKMMWSRTWEKVSVCSANVLQNFT